MLFGFCITTQGAGTDYGLISADDETAALEELRLTFPDEPDITLLERGEALVLEQYAGIAFLTTER